jgi:hypothetical protein
MAEGECRLGDWVDDYCTRCKLIMNHYIVSMVNGEIVKVRCQTCQHEQNFRHGEEGKKKKESRQALFDQVVAGFHKPETSSAPVSKGRPGKR